MRDRLITKRQKNKKVIGYIREIEPYLSNSCRYSKKYYILFDAKGNLIAKDTNYNNLHKKLYEM